MDFSSWPPVGLYHIEARALQEHRRREYVCWVEWGPRSQAEGVHSRSLVEFSFSSHSALDLFCWGRQSGMGAWMRPGAWKLFAYPAECATWCALTSPTPSLPPPFSSPPYTSPSLLFPSLFPLLLPLSFSLSPSPSPVYSPSLHPRTKHIFNLPSGVSSPRDLGRRVCWGSRAPGA